MKRILLLILGVLTQNLYSKAVETEYTFNFTKDPKSQKLIQKNPDPETTKSKKTLKLINSSKKNQKNSKNRELKSIKQIDKELKKTEIQLHQTGNTARLSRQIKAEQRFQAQLAQEQDISMLQANKKLLPVVTMTKIFRKVADTLRKKKIAKKLKAKRSREMRLKKKKTELIKEKLDKENAEIRKLIHLRKTRKQRRIKRKLKERLTSLLGGSDELELKLDLANDEFGIATIVDKVGRDLNSVLFMTAEKARGLRLFSRSLVFNGEKLLDSAFEKVDNVLGMNMASDRAIRNNMN